MTWGLGSGSAVYLRAEGLEAGKTLSFISWSNGKLCDRDATAHDAAGAGARAQLEDPSRGAEAVFHVDQA